MLEKIQPDGTVLSSTEIDPTGPFALDPAGKTLYTIRVTDKGYNYIFTYDLVSRYSVSSIQVPDWMGFIDLPDHHGTTTMPVAVTDKWVFSINNHAAGKTPVGLLRFPRATLDSFELAGAGKSYSWVTAGANGLLYALRSVRTLLPTVTQVDIYNPDSLALVGSFPIDGMVQTLAVRSTGDIYLVKDDTLNQQPPDEAFYHYSPGGSFVARHPIQHPALLYPYRMFSFVMTPEGAIACGIPLKSFNCLMLTDITFRQETVLELDINFPTAAYLSSG